MKLSRLYAIWMAVSLTAAYIAHALTEAFDVEVEIPVAELLSRISDNANYGAYFLSMYLVLPILLYAADRSEDLRSVKPFSHPFWAALFSISAICFIAYICCFMSPNFKVGGGRLSLVLAAAAHSWLLLGLIYGSILYIASIFMVLLKISIHQLRRSS